MILESRKRRWWHLFFLVDDSNRASTSWVEKKKCNRTLTTSEAEHLCQKVGPHWDHECADDECKFRWAA